MLYTNVAWLQGDELQPVHCITGEPTAACTRCKMGAEDLETLKGEEMEDVRNWQSN